MQGVPPFRDSQVTLQNYRKPGFSRWAVRSMGAPTHVVMIPRGGEIHKFGQAQVADWDSSVFDRKVADSFADDVVVMQGNNIAESIRIIDGLSRVTGCPENGRGI